jgi:hypothetical protein
MYETHPRNTSFSSHLAASFFEAATTNALLRFGSAFAVALAMASCVPAKNYDEARSAAETEFGAHGKTRARLEAAHQRIRSLEQTLAERERALENGESSVAAAKLESIVIGKDKEAALELVEQLRSELARTGNHLVAFSDEKRTLAHALVLAEERVRSIEAAEKNLGELIATARDLAVAVGPDAKESGIELGAQGGQIVLGVPRKMLFADGSDDLVVDAAPVLSAVSEVTSEHTGVRIVLGGPEKAPLVEARIISLGAALRDRGIPENRLVLPARVREEEPTIAPVATEAASPSGAPDAPVVAPAPGAAAPAAPLEPPDDASARYEIRFAI